MKILNLTSKYFSPSFKSIDEYTAKDKNTGRIFTKTKNSKTDSSLELIASNYTYFFRHDFFTNNFNKPHGALEYNKRLEKIVSSFPRDEKVNIYNFACSDGSEPYSFAIALMELLGNDAERFFPIYASDINPDLIKKTKECVKANDSDVSRLWTCTNNSADKYFSIRRTDFNKWDLTPKKPLKEAVFFSSKDAVQGIDDIKTKNNIIILRNVWRYLKPNELVNLCNAISKLDNSSVIIIGELDRKNPNNTGIPFAQKLLYALGFINFDSYSEGLVFKKQEQKTISPDEILKIAQYDDIY